MKSKHRRNHRRYSGRRRNERTRSKIAVFLIFIFIIAVIIGSVFLGKYLKAKADISESNRNNEDTVSNADTAADPEKESILFDKRPPEQIDAEYLSVDNIETFAGEGSSVSLLLRDKAGKLYYSSPVAQTLGGQNVENGLRRAEDLIAKLDESNSYISVCFALAGHSEEKEAMIDAVHAFENALIGEIAAAGADEILLCGFDTIDPSQVSMLCAFSESYRKTAASEVPLGLLIPYSFFSLTNANELCRALADHFEFLAVDYTDLSESEEMPLAEAVSARIDTMQMYLSRYSLRVVLNAESSEYESAKTALKEAAVYSIQSISRADLAGSLISDITDTDTDSAE